MKTVRLVILLLLFPLATFAQKAPRLSVELLGVDFSMVDVIGADEMPGQFHKAFYGINTLMHTEPGKYNFAKFLKLNVESISVTTATERSSQNEDNYLERSKEGVDITKILSSYPSSSGNKLLVIAIELNKSSLKAHYKAVIFDGESKEVISITDLIGKPGGFGLRNYWAGGLYDGLKRAK